MIPIALSILLVSQVFGGSILYAAAPAPVFLDPKTIPKWVNQLVVPPVYSPDTSGIGHNYTIDMVSGTQQILPPTTPLPGGGFAGPSQVWGYQGDAIAKGATLGVPDGTPLPGFFWSPSATFEEIKGVPAQVNWTNNIISSHLFAVDPTLQWANPTGAFPDGDAFAQMGPFPLYPPGFDGTITPNNPDGLNAQSPIPLVPHLHGAEVLSEYDGGPEAWWTSTGLTGPNYRTLGGTATAGQAAYYYHNEQEANTLWYHDHALGVTRINVMSGLAGFYNLREDLAATGVGVNTFDQYLTQTFQYGVSEIPIAIQDRTFDTLGQIWYPDIGLNTLTHPYWSPEFFGNTIMVNGMAWPNLDVTPGWYRLRLLDGSNARFYTIALKDQVTGAKIPFMQIGGDGGYLQSSVLLKELTIAPGERADILVDFSALAPGTTILMENKAKTPFPAGAQADPKTTGMIMLFTVKPTGTAVTQGVPTAQVTLPLTLNPTLPAGVFPTLAKPPVTNVRFLTLNEIMGPAGPLMAVINGQYFTGTATETPKIGTTEDWVIINLTGDTHPIHTHLATFQLVSRQRADVAKYTTAWLALQKDPLGQPLTPPFPKDYVPIPLDPTPYVKGKITTATPSEMAWKDTIQMHPGEVTIIRIKFTQQDGNPFPFDATAGPGYVWHCHILEHEDNEMMRPLIVMP